MKLTSLAQTPVLPVSHNAAIEKQRLLSSGDINGITNFSRAVFPAGEVAPTHCHDDMTEVFFIVSGEAEIEVDGKVIPLPPGSCITIEPGEYHELRNVGKSEMVVMYFGVE